MVEYKCFIPAARNDSLQLSSPCQSSRYGMPFAAPSDYKSCFPCPIIWTRRRSWTVPKPLASCLNDMDQSRKPDYSDLEEERFPLTYGPWTSHPLDDSSFPGRDVPWTICPSYLSYQYHVLQYAGQFIRCVWPCWSKCSPIFQEHFIHCFQIVKNTDFDIFF